MSLIDDAMETAKLDDKLNSLEPEFIMESIREQLENPLDNTIKRNYLKGFEKQCKKLKESSDSLDTEDIDAQRELVHLDIIRNIENKFDIEIDTVDQKISKLCKHLYKFFAVEIVDNITQFLEMYLIENADEISRLLSVEKNNVTSISAKDELGISGPMLDIISNISESVHIIANMELQFEDFLEVLRKHPESSGSVDEIYELNKLVISDDNENLYTTIMMPVINEEAGFTTILNNLQMNLYRKFTNDRGEDSDE